MSYKWLALPLYDQTSSRMHYVYIHVWSIKLCNLTRFQSKLCEKLFYDEDVSGLYYNDNEAKDKQWISSMIYAWAPRFQH